MQERDDYRAARGPAGPEIPFAVGFACGLVALAVLHALLPSSLDREIELVRLVRDLAQEEYVREVDPRKLVDDALRGMVGGLDRYSRYYGPEEVAEVNRETEGEYRGIGVVFRAPVIDGVIRFALPDSPADRAGLGVGDRITSIDGNPVELMDEEEFRRYLHGDEELLMVAEGREGTRREVVVRPEAVIDPTVRHARMLDPELGIGYLAIVSFSRRTADEFDEWTGWLREQGLHALVLDLRANPGGILDSAIQIADRFVETGTIVSTRSRNEAHSTQASREKTSWARLPLIVLVNGDSASASEVLVGALQDHRVGVVAGEPTYGKGAVQKIHRFEDHRAIVKLTSSYYFTPAGRRIEREDDGRGGAEWNGVTPDLLVKISASVRREIHRFLRTYSPPPDALAELEAWEREEGVELVARAPLDPQLDAAVDLLRGKAPACVDHAD
ncbi:MAG: S41 family peptidase [Planctomycetota bacterium]|nr:S41 family peptidase [Planctomycetota bacterium]